jgi:hypothetical protein
MRAVSIGFWLVAATTVLLYVLMVVDIGRQIGDR